MEEVDYGRNGVCVSARAYGVTLKTIAFWLVIGLKDITVENLTPNFLFINWDMLANKKTCFRNTNCMTEEFRNFPILICCSWWLRYYWIYSSKKSFELLVPIRCSCAKDSMDEVTTINFIFFWNFISTCGDGARPWNIYNPMCFMTSSTVKGT